MNQSTSEDREKQKQHIKTAITIAEQKQLLNKQTLISKQFDDECREVIQTIQETPTGVKKRQIYKKARNTANNVIQQKE